MSTLGTTATVAAVLVSLLAASCAGGTSTVAAADTSGDGRLDCAQGAVPRQADIEVFAADEDEAVALALESWTSDGATLVALPPDESWSAVRDGKDVAIAYPERNGDGRWTVHDVKTCGPPSVGPAPIDGRLDCANDSSWSQSGSFSASVIGAPTSKEALLPMLEPFRDRHGGRIVIVDDNQASLVVDDREQVVATAVETDAGGWVVPTVSGCQGFG